MRVLFPFWQVLHSLFLLSNNPSRYLCWAIGLYGLYSGERASIGLYGLYSLEDVLVSSEVGVGLVPFIIFPRYPRTRTDFFVLILFVLIFNFPRQCVVRSHTAVAQHSSLLSPAADSSLWGFSRFFPASRTFVRCPTPSARVLSLSCYFVFVFETGADHGETLATAVGGQHCYERWSPWHDSAVACAPGRLALALSEVMPATKLLQWSVCDV